MRFLIENEVPDEPDPVADSLQADPEPDRSVREGGERETIQPTARAPHLLDARVRIHNEIIDELDLTSFDRLSRAELKIEIRGLVTDFIRREKMLLGGRDLDVLLDEVVDEMIGFGPIEPLLRDHAVSDILINTFDKIYVERGGKLERTALQFRDEAHLLRILNKIVAGTGRRVDESSPMVDARLPDGSRVNAAIRPVAIDGPLVSIRKFSKKPIALNRLMSFGALTSEMADTLSAAVKGRKSILISGGTGSGKTTMLNALSGAIPFDERLITIEDAAELQLQQPHVGRLETRPPNAEGRGEIRQRDLVKNALRMRPDRIILGEVRGEEAFDMLQAMNTGHEGSMATIHANNARDAIARLEQMVGMAGLPISASSIRAQIVSAIDVIVQLQRFADGTRRITGIAEVAGQSGETVQMQDIFIYNVTHMDAGGRIAGYFTGAGIRPAFLDSLKPYGIDLPQSHFKKAREALS